MNYPINKKMPKVLFIQLLMDKALMLKKHLKDTESDLRLIANIGPNMATIKLYNIREEEDSQKIHVTISNLGDIEEQLYQLWVQLNYILKQYCPIQLYRDF